MDRTRRWRRRLYVAIPAGLLAAYFGSCAILFLTDPQTVLSGDRQGPSATTSPSGFLLGTATAAHQIEGGNTGNDWARFEQEPGRIKRGDKSGRASDHWNRVAEDIRLMRELGSNAYRFSIEWSRLEPAAGTWDEAAWGHYEDEVRQLRAAGIVPMVTLLHFTLPLWLADRGGVTAPEFPERFARFAAEAARRLGPMVDLWCTLNEPNVQMIAGYIEGAWPPGKRALEEAGAAFAGLVRGHAAAAAALHHGDPGAQVGVAMNLVVIEPASRWWVLDWIAARLAGNAYNWAFYDSIVAGRVRLTAPGLPAIDEPLPALLGSADFFGLNYYTRFLIRFSPRSPGLIERRQGSGDRSDMDWEIYPDGLRRMLHAASRRYRLPIYVTENGIADAGGIRRAAFIDAHRAAVDGARTEGVPVRGYFYWSLMDNFEWAEGFTPRFGLYRVDYDTYARAPAPGSEAFRAWTRATLNP